MILRYSNVTSKIVKFSKIPSAPPYLCGFRNEVGSRIVASMDGYVHFGFEIFYIFFEVLDSKPGI